MSEWKVKIGDKVRVVFNDDSQLYGDLLYIPVATGDSWVVQTYHKGKKDLIAYIQQFEVMFVVPEPPKETKE